MLILRLALRDLRGGLAGLRLLAICLFLGAAALAGVGSLSASILAALSERGQTILGGDISFEIPQRRAMAEERAAFFREGVVSESISMRAMAARLDGRESVLAELKGVDGRYPLYGALSLVPGALAKHPRGDQVAIAPALADRLRVGVGDRIRLGAAKFEVIGLIADEPDRIGSGFSLGPTALVDINGLAATGLVQPGSLYKSRYRIRLAAGADPKSVAQRLSRRFPSAGWEIEDRTNSAPGTRRFIERLDQFLTLVGLASLIVAGIGVGNGVASWLEAKRGGIAALKTLGATSRTVLLVHLVQMLLVAALGIGAGLVLGALLPAVLAFLAGSALPVPPKLAVYPLPLLASAIYGVLTALLFAIAPLARAGAVPAAALFRGGVEERTHPPLRVLGALLLLALAIAGLAIGTAREPLFAAGFIGAMVLLLALLTLMGGSIRALARRIPRPRRPLVRLAIANLHRPGAQTSRLVVALGLGLTLFAALAVIETNLSGQIANTVPKKAPSFFILDIPSGELDRFRALVHSEAPGADVVTVPSLRGPIVAVKDRRVADMKTIPEGAWILRGDRGLTFAKALPEGSRVVAGKWWPADYSGPPLVSLDARAAEALGLKVGDSITVSVLGVEIAAKIASLREIDWDTMGFNFAMIFSPGTLDSAPYSVMATVELPAAREQALNRTLTQAFPSISIIRVKDVIATVGSLLEQLGLAVRAAASVAILSGVAVLTGAIAASRRARIYDSVLIKLLGGTRRQIISAQALEYAVLAVAIALVAFAFGGAGGWYVVTQIFDLQWAPDWGVVLATLAVGALVILGLGLAGSLPVLSARPARALREL